MPKKKKKKGKEKPVCNLCRSPLPRGKVSPCKKCRDKQKYGCRWQQSYKGESP